MRPRTILLIEDNPTTRKMLRITLESEDYIVVDARDATTALDRLREVRPDLIIQDIVLPDGDGLTLTARMRALPNGAHVPIIILSGFAGRFDEARASSGQYAEILLKPVAPSRLVEVVRSHMPGGVDRRRSGGGRRLLLIDDSAPQLKIDVLRFVQAGFRVTVASSGEEALVKAREIIPDVIVSDVIMPGMDGFELCQTLRTDDELGHVPVVLVSSHVGDERDVALGRQVGASALIARRPDAVELLRSVLDAIDTGAPVPSADVAAVVPDRGRRVVNYLDQQVARHNRLEAQCTRQSAELSLLGGVAEALTRNSSDMSTALRDVFAATLDAAGISLGALYLSEPGETRVSLRQAIGFSDTDRLEDFFGHFSVLSDILVSQFPAVIPSPLIPEAVTSDILARAQVTTLQVVPIVFEGQSVGALVFGSTALPLSGDDLVAFARAIGAQVVQSLTIIRAFDRLKAVEASLLLANEELERKVEARTNALSVLAKSRQDMIAIVSHDLRNPLNVISMAMASPTFGNSDTPLEQVERRRTVPRIRRAAAQMDYLITNLLDAASIEDASLTLARAPLSPQRLLDDAIAAHQPLAEGKSIRLEVRCTADPRMVAADSGRLSQIFSNLIGNAIKFTEAGGLITLTAEYGESDATFSVADSGCGINPAHIPHIFDRYWQAKHLRRGGVGLGLAIAKGIVDAHGGRLWITSEPGVGSTFSFTIPLWTALCGSAQHDASELMRDLGAAHA